VNLYKSDDFFKKRDEITYRMAQEITKQFRDKFSSEVRAVGWSVWLIFLANLLRIE